MNAKNSFSLSSPIEHYQLVLLAAVALAVAEVATLLLLLLLLLPLDFWTVACRIWPAELKIYKAVNQREFI